MKNIEQIEKYIALLLQWNQKINLIGKSTVDDIWKRHIEDSAQLMEYITEEEMQKLDFADFGSGAGLPGIILSILGVKNIALIEKSVRKCEFLMEAIKISKNPIKIINQNIFEIENIKFDIIVSRALASLEELLFMVKPFLKNSSKCIFLKGKKLPLELENARKKYNFDYQLFPSKTSEEGQIIIIKNLK